MMAEMVSQKRLQHGEHSEGVKQRKGVLKDNRPLGVSCAKAMQMGMGGKARLGNSPIQLVHKTMDAPTKVELELLNIWNEASHHLIKLLNYKLLGMHGTNFKHAMSMMRDGIKIRIPNEKRTSDVTPKDHVGFYVDTSEKGDAHAHDFAKKAAYGEPDLPSDDAWENNALQAGLDAKKAEVLFRDHVAAMQATGKRGVVLQVWGPQDIKPKDRYHGQQHDEEVYAEGADQILVTILKYI
jgi:hypothetical protein